MLTLAFILAIPAFFVLLVSFAGSHGHLGLFDHADSFLLYSIALILLTISAFLTQVRRVSYVFTGILIYFITMFVVEFVSTKPNIRLRDYWLILVLFSLNLFVLIYYRQKYKQ